MTGVPSVASQSSRPTLLSLFELGARLLLLTGALLYGLGFIVENIHLARFGYFALTLFERRYALAGFWALSPLLLFFIFQWMGDYSDKIRSDPATHRVPKWIRYVLSAVVYVGLFYAVQVAIGQLLGINLSWFIWLPFIFGGGVLYLLTARKAIGRWRELTTTRSLDPSKASPPQLSPWQVAREVLAQVEWTWVAPAVSYLVFFTYALFPRIPASWGGGGPETVQLLLPDEEVAVLSRLGLARSGPQLSAPTVLVATTAEDYVLLLDSTRVVYLRRDLVRGVTIKGHFKTPAPIRHPYTPADTLR